MITPESHIVFRAVRLDDIIDTLQIERNIRQNYYNVFQNKKDKEKIEFFNKKIIQYRTVMNKLLKQMTKEETFKFALRSGHVTLEELQDMKEQQNKK